MELTFNKVNNKYIATFTATSNFNIHIEQTGGIVELYYTSVEDAKPKYLKALNNSKDEKVIDVDCEVLVFPKYVTLESSVLPTKAIVTYNQA